MSTRARSLLARARVALATAGEILSSDPVGAANRTYYAAFDAARAALSAAGESPRTHTGVETRFVLHFVRSERISRDVGRALGDARSLRMLADYDEDATISPDDVRPVLGAVAKLIEAVEAMIG